MELAPIMPTDGAASAIVLARLAESRQRKTAVNVSIFANLLAKLRISEQNAKKNKRIYSFFVERERFRRSQSYNFFLQNTYCLQDFYLHKACGALVVRVRAFPQFVFEKHKINRSKTETKKQLEDSNYIQNYIQKPFFGGLKWRKPLLRKGFRLVRETGLETQLMSKTAYNLV